MRHGDWRDSRIRLRKEQALRRRPHSRNARCSGLCAAHRDRDGARRWRRPAAGDSHRVQPRVGSQSGRCRPGSASPRKESGSGTVSGPGIDCGPKCAANYPWHTSVTLTATPAAGSTFTGWSDACTGLPALRVPDRCATLQPSLGTRRRLCPPRGGAARPTRARSVDEEGPRQGSRGSLSVGPRVVSAARTALGLDAPQRRRWPLLVAAAVIALVAAGSLSVPPDARRKYRG